LQGLGDGEFIVLLERHPNNNWDAEKVSEKLGQPNERGFILSKDDVAWIIEKEFCDVFIADLQGHLKILGCHEDETKDGERLVWIPNS
jgi:hypothetical protein